MFCRGDFAEYEACFKKAMALPGIRGNTIHEEYLRAIHENPRRYAGYKRRSIPGNMGLMGSAPAEQNHSSVTARVGPGGIMSITENMSELLVRQQDIAREDQEKFTKFYSKWKTFQSKYVNDDTSRKMDESAHHALSPYAYTTFFKNDILPRVRRSTVTFSESSPGYVFVHPKKLDVPLLPGFTIEDAETTFK
jgi:hypothetical protein